MVYNIFLIWFMLIILINIRRTNNSLLSRFRNPNDYVPREKYYLPEDIDDDLYAELLQEVPELAGKLRYKENEVRETTRLPFIRKETNGTFEIVPNVEEFDTEEDEDQEEFSGQQEYVTVTPGTTKIISSSRRLPFLTRSSINSSDEQARERVMDPEKWFSPEKVRVATCYWCGMNQTTSIPINSICYDAFESPDWRARTLARYFRAHCYKSHYGSSGIKTFRYNQHIYRYDTGLIRIYYAWFVGGCFKRFLDVGKVYTQRGCRKYWPMYASTHNFADHRFTRLEALLKHEKEICIVSPQASLTPFSRSISLYVRYHVCICQGRYCNSTTKSEYSFTFILLIIILVFILRIY